MNDTTYLNFDLLIEPGQRTDDVIEHLYRVRVLNSPGGEAVGEFEFPFSDQDLTMFSRLLSNSGLNRHMNLGLTPQHFGNRLFQALFHKEVGNRLLVSLDAAKREGKGLRILLRLNDAPELAALPWEYLYHRTDNRFLALSGQTPIVRYLELAKTEQPLEVVRPLRILIVIANPINSPPLDVEREWKKMQDALFDLRASGLVEIERLPNATLSQLRQSLRQKEYHILHFIGHGVFDNVSQRNGLLFVDEKGRADFVSASALSTSLHDHRSLRLAFLNACEGARASQKSVFAGTAQRLVQQGLSSAIAMQFPVSDDVATNLAYEFYKALADGYPVDGALGDARKAIFEQGNQVEWGTPVLFMRAPNGKLFEIDGVGEDAPATGVAPFKGLPYFEEKDADRFFGREALTAKLINKLRDDRFLAVIGPSGSGKSSLVRAGVIPALKMKIKMKMKKGEALDPPHDLLPPTGSELWPVHIMRPTARPLEELAVCLTPDAQSISTTKQLIDDLTDNAHSLHLHVRKLLSQHSAQRLLLVVDQFEELFTLCHTPQEHQKRQAFIDNLMYAVTVKGPTVVVITLRGDFYAQCAQFEPLRQILPKQQELIGPMSEEELRCAIEGPARYGNWEFEPGLVDQLLKDVGNEPGALPLLSHALLKTWERRRARTMTFMGYKAAGGIQGAIAKTAEQVFKKLNDKQQQIAQQLFLDLTELGEGTQDTRRRVARQDLVPNDDFQKKLAVEGVLLSLSKARLITTSTDSVEVAHEALIREWPMLRMWLDQNRDALRIRRQLSEDAREWSDLNHDQGALYRGARLANALEWAETHLDQLNTLERRFIGASKEFAEREQLEKQERQRKELAQARALAKAQAREQKRLRSFSKRLSGLLLLAILMTGIALYAFNDANKNEQIAKENAQKAKEHAQEAENNAQEADDHRKEAEKNAQEADDHRKEAEENSRISLAQSLVGQVPYIFNTSNDSGLATLLSLESRYLNEELGRQAQELTGFFLLDVLSQPYFNVILGNHYSTIKSTAFHPDGKMLVSATNAGNLHFWDLSQENLEVQFINGHDKGLTRAAFAPNGRLASGGADGMIHLWDFTASEPTPKLFASDLGAIKTLVFSPLTDSALLAAAGEAKTIWVWDLNQNFPPFMLQGHEAIINSVAFSSDGHTLASGDAKGKIYLWDLASAPAQLLIPQPNGSETSSETGDSVLLPASQAITPIAMLPQQANDILALAFSPDRRWLATASKSSTILIYDMSDLNADPIQLKGHTRDIASLEFNFDSTQLISASFDLTVRLWDLSKGPADATSDVLKGHADQVNTATFSPDGEQLASGSDDWVVRLWNLPKGDHTRLENMTSAVPIVLDHDQQKVWSVAFSADGKYMASGSDDGKIRLWPSEVLSNPSLEPILLPGNEKWVESVAFHPNSQILATASGDKNIYLWDINKPTSPIDILTGHEKGVRSIAFSPDGKTLASGSYDKRIRLWDMNRWGTESRVLAKQEKLVLSVAFSPDGKTFASASENGTIYLWDLTQTNPVPKELKAHTLWVQSIAFSPDGKSLASGGGNRTVRLWDLTSDDPSQDSIVFEGHTNRIEFVTFTPDGKTLVSASADRTIRLWDPTNRDPDAKPFVFIRHSDWVRSLAFTPDGNTLASSSDDGTVRLWVPHIDMLADLGCKLARRNLSWSEWEMYLEEEPYRRTCEQYNLPQSVISGLIVKSKEFAQKGDITNAVETLKYMLELKAEPKWVTIADPNFKPNLRLNVERYAKVYQLISEGAKLIEEKDLNGAMAKFDEALELDPKLEVDSQIEIEGLVALFVTTGKELAQEGNVDEALDTFKKAKLLDLRVKIPADAWYALCQAGATPQYADKVLSACNEAIKLEPENGQYYQSRGIVRQLTGDSDGALEDLQFYVEWEKKQE